MEQIQEKVKIKYCGRKIGFGEYSYKGECEQCYKGMSKVTQYTVDKYSISYGMLIVMGIIFLVFLLPIIWIFGGSQKSAEERKEKELKAFEKQLKQDPSTWTKEERDRYNSFIEWDMQNER